jgi:hypothetical protein
MMESGRVLVKPTNYPPEKYSNFGIFTAHSTIIFSLQLIVEKSSQFSKNCLEVQCLTVGSPHIIALLTFLSFSFQMWRESFV